jgi:hypothetical protein
MGSAAWNWSEDGGVSRLIFFCVRFLQKSFTHDSSSLLPVRFLPACAALSGGEFTSVAEVRSQ